MGLKGFWKQLLLAFLGIAALLFVLGWTSFPGRTGAFQPRIWIFDLQHEVFSVRDEDGAYPSREVHFQVRATRDAAAEVQDCIRAYEIVSLDDGQMATCVGYGSLGDFEIQQQNPGLRCEVARAIQDPYGTAKEARTILSRHQRCERVKP